MENTKPFWKSPKGILVIVIIVIILGYAGSTYNSLVSSNESIDNQWAQVESQYQRRLDLIPNLVNSVKGAMVQEQKVFGDIADARTKYSGAKTVDEKISAASQIESSLGRLLVVMENYPTLLSMNTVQNLMSQLEGTENRVSVERMRFNDAVRPYNVKVKRFPSSILAAIFGFDARPYFEAAEGADKAPTVNLNQ